MPDSTIILTPGWRALDANGNILDDAVLAFFVAGTSTPLEVFSDADLSVSLGVTVNCNSAGFPVSSGNAKVLIYTGAAPYKIRLTSTDFGGTVFEFDEVLGALDTSGFLTSAAVARESVVAESSNRSIGLSDLGKLINCNVSAGALTMTIDDASDLGDGWYVGIRHDGTANQCKITGNGTDTFGLNGVNVTSFSLTGRGQVVWIVCNGTSFKIDKQVTELIGNGIGVIKIADRLSTPPGAPNPGERYIVTATPTGAWSTFAENDIAEATGFATWFKYTPPADCGWTAYVQDEDTFYSFSASSWKGTAGLISGLTENTAPAPATTFLPIYNSATAVAERVKTSNLIRAGTSQATTTGTAFDYTSLPPEIKRITVMFNEVSLSGTDNYLVQIGDSGGVSSSGYTSASAINAGGGGVASTSSTAGFILMSQNATRPMTGHLILTRFTGNTWIASHSMGQAASPQGIQGGGVKVLSNELDRLRITRTGTDTFDAGSVNIFYE